MDDALILADEARNIAIDWRYVLWTRQQGDLTLMLTWDWGGDQPQGVLIIAPTYWDRDSGDPTLCLIRREDAWRWSRTHNNDRHMIGHWGFGRPPSSDNWQEANAAYYALLLGMNGDDRRVRNRIRGMIEDHLSDLVLMPAPPRRETDDPGATAILTHGDGRVTEFQIKDS